jgi:hypothetical protein
MLGGKGLDAAPRLLRKLGGGGLTLGTGLGRLIPLVDITANLTDPFHDGLLKKII